MNSLSSPVRGRFETVAEQIRRELLAEVDVTGYVSDDRTTFAPHGTY